MLDDDDSDVEASVVMIWDETSKKINDKKLIKLKKLN